MKATLIVLTSLLFVSTLGADTKVMLPDSEKFTKNEKDIFVEAVIPGTFTTPEGVLAALFFLTHKASDTSLSNPFVPEFISSTSSHKGALRLGAYYHGVEKNATTITVSFSKEAMRYLNSTVSIQHCTKGAIERTLKLNFPDVEEIAYKIDGEIVSDWDA